MMENNPNVPNMNDSQYDGKKNPFMFRTAKQLFKDPWDFSSQNNGIHLGSWISESIHGGIRLSNNKIMHIIWG